jgi:hypothetical protein
MHHFACGNRSGETGGTVRFSWRNCYQESDFRDALSVPLIPAPVDRGPVIALRA